MAVHTPDPDDSILTVKRRHEGALLAIPGVREARVGPVVKNGHRTGEIGIVVYVDQKLPPEQIDPKGMVPTYLDGRRVDVQPIRHRRLPIDWRTEAHIYAERAWRHKLILGAIATGALTFALLVVYGPLGPPVSFGPLIPRISCNSWVTADRGRHIEVLEQVRKRNNHQLRAIQGLYRHELGFECVDGRKMFTGFTVYMNANLMNFDEAIDAAPSSIEGCSVEVRMGVPDPLLERIVEICE